MKSPAHNFGEACGRAKIGDAAMIHVRRDLTQSCSLGDPTRGTTELIGGPDDGTVIGWPFCLGDRYRVICIICRHADGRTLILRDYRIRLGDPTRADYVRDTYAWFPGADGDRIEDPMGELLSRLGADQQGGRY